MNHLTNLYKYKCEQLQEQIYHLTRMLNEAEDGSVGGGTTPPPTVILRADPAASLAMGAGYGDGNVNNPQNTVLYGPNYKWPKLGTGSGVSIWSFFPPGLSPTVRPVASDYPGGIRNKRYQRDSNNYDDALEAWNNRPILQQTGTENIGGAIRRGQRWWNDNYI